MVSSPPPQGDHTHYLNLTDAVELGYGAYQTLRGWIKQGKLPAVKIGGRVKVLRSDLDALAVPTQPSHTFETVEAAVARIAATAPPLTDEQVRRLSALLDGAS